ncbi:MAG TPA: 2Fe-2S iron-sulfur cluster-binding protein [Ramlibacter sp.]|nr:2Fe-2S iron-sulfur cluster-binding protein [Ramlibacter sp.]
MPTITYIQPSGRAQAVEVPVNSSVMQGAVDHLIDGVAAECGGCCSCATCVVHVDDAWLPVVGEACDMERDLLGDAVPRNGRLSCQIEVTADMDGLVVRIPEEQAA